MKGTRSWLNLYQRRASDPSIGHSGPFRDRVAAGDEVIHRLRRFEIRVSETAVAGIGWKEQSAFARLVVQRVVQPRDHPRGIPKCRMGGDVLDAFAVDVDFAPIAKFLEIF